MILDKLKTRIKELKNKYKYFKENYYKNKAEFYYHQFYKVLEKWLEEYSEKEVIGEFKGQTREQIHELKKNKSSDYKLDSYYELDYILNQDLMDMYISIINFENIPENIKKELKLIIEQSKNDYLFRSNNHNLFNEIKNKEIYNSNRKEDTVLHIAKECYSFINHFHIKDNPENNSSLARAVYYILGMDFKTPAEFVITYTKDGYNARNKVYRTDKTGIAGQVIDIADYYSIPIYNLANKSDLKEIKDLLDIDNGVSKKKINKAKKEISATPNESKKIENKSKNQSNSNVSLEKLLKEEREEIANDLDISIKRVCNSKAMTNIQKKRPTSKEEFLNLDGVGAKTFERCGEKFLKLIRKNSKDKKNNFKNNNSTKSKKDKNYVVFDIETTGLKRKWDSIIEIAGIKTDLEGNVIEEFSQLIKPKDEIPEFITELTSITNEMVEDKPNIFEVLPNFFEFVDKESIIVGHNVEKFDLQFIEEKRKLYNKYNENLEPLENDTIDTLKMARNLINNTENHKLGTLLDHFDIEIETQHRAISDVKGNLELLFKFFELQEKKQGECLKNV